MLDIRDLRIEFPEADGGITEAVRGIDLHMDPGERLGLVGESGSGKTVTSLALAGLLEGKKATTYPGFAKLEHKANYTHRGVEVDDMLITAKSPAFTLEFALTIVEALKGIDVVREVKNGLCI